MHKVAKQYARHPKVKALLQWAEQVTAGSSGDFKPAAKRAVAIEIAITSVISITIASARAIASASTIASAIASASAKAIASASASASAIVSARSSARAIAKAIAKASAIAIAIELEQSGVFTGLELSNLTNQLQNFQSALQGSDIIQIKKVSEQVVSAYLEAFHLTQELITYYDEEFQALNKYLYSIDLLLKCKKESARLSPATWDAIEAELLLPPDD